jgi:hypothetical protein
MCQGKIHSQKEAAVQKGTDLMKVEKLTTDLATGNDRQRRAASYKLSKLQDPSTVPHLIAAFKDKDHSVRRNVIAALRAIGTEEAIEFLESNGITSSEVSKGDSAGCGATMKLFLKTLAIALSLVVCAVVKDVFFPSPPVPQDTVRNLCDTLAVSYTPATDQSTSISGTFYIDVKGASPRLLGSYRDDLYSGLPDSIPMTKDSAEADVLLCVEIQTITSQCGPYQGLGYAPKSEQRAKLVFIDMETETIIHGGHVAGESILCPLVLTISSNRLRSSNLHGKPPSISAVAAAVERRYSAR